MAAHDWTPRSPDERIDTFGRRALSYILTFVLLDALTIEDLEQADRAAMIAVTARGISPTALDRLSDARRRIQRLIIDRRKATAVKALAGATLHDRPNEGPMAALRDRPLTEPPSPSYADQRPTLRDVRADVRF